MAHEDNAYARGQPDKEKTFVVSSQQRILIKVNQIIKKSLKLRKIEMNLK